MATPTKPIGVSGVSAPSGWLQVRDRNPDMRWPGGAGSASTVGEYLHFAATDPAVASCLAAIVLPIARGEWTIEAEDDEDPAVLEFLEQELLERRAPDFRDMVREIAHAMITAGFHSLEPVYRRRSDGKIGVRSLAPRPAWTVQRFLFDDDGELSALEQSAPDTAGRYVTRELPADSLLIFTHSREGNDPTGKSMLRPVIQSARIRDFLKRLISVRNEREAIGVPIGEYPATASEAEKSSFEDFLAQYRAHERAYLMHPAGFKVTIPEGKVGSSDALRADSAYLAVEIQSAFLQAWQSLGQSGSSSGGRAVGETQAGPYYLALESIMGEIAAPFDGLIAKLVDLNFGKRDAGKYPYLCPPKIKVEDVLAGILPILESIKAGGVSVTPDVENELRERTGLEELDEVAHPAPVPAPQPPPSEGTVPQEADTPDPAEDLPDDEAAAEPMRATDRGAVQLMAWRPSRVLSPAEQRVAFGEMVARLDAAPADLQAAIGNAVLRNRGAFLKWIRPFARRMASGDRSGYDALAKADLPKGIRAAIVGAVRTYAAEMHAFGRAQAERERRKSPAAAEKQARREQEAIREEILDAPVASFADEPTPADLPPGTAAEASVFGDRIADEFLRIARLAATRAAANGVRLAPGAIPLVDVIEEAVDAAISTAAAGTAATKEAAVAISVKALQGGRDEVFREDKDLITSVEYSAAMDPNTCGACGEWDGKSAPSIDEADFVLPAVPNLDCDGTAARCRCVWIVNYD